MRRRLRNDEGTVLVLALAFLALFGLVTGTLLTLGTTSMRVTASVRDDAASTYAQDGAIDGAINNLSSGTTSGVQGTDTTCFSLPASAVAGGSSAFTNSVPVRCLGRSGSGAAIAAPVSGSQPAQAILAGGSNSSEGVNLTSSSTDVQGNVVARTRVAGTADSSLGVSGTLTAPACGVTVHADTSQCGTGTAAADPGASDLGWAAPGLGTTASPVSQYPAPVDVMPTCAPTVTISPASFYSAAALNALFASCSGALFHFLPGVYLFDFLDTGASAARVWTIGSSTTTTVGGAFPASGPLAASTCDPTISGVEFVFAGESQLKVTGGNVDLCAAFTDTTPYDASSSPASPATPGQHIAVYGLKTSGTRTDTGTRTPKSTTLSGWTLPSGKTGPQTFAVADGVKATTSLTTSGSTSTISGAIASLVPPDATITDASLTANYTETGNGSLGFNALFLGGSYYFPIGTIPCNGTCSGPTYTWSCGTASGNSGTCASYGVIPSAVDPVTVQVTATDNANSAFTATIDSLVVSFSYTEPLSASSGCLLTAPYPSGGCALLSASGTAPSTLLRVQGTIYAWLAPVDLSVKLQPAVIVDRGIVARDVQLGLTPAAPCQGPLIALSAAGTLPREAMAEASVGGVVGTRAEVCFADVGGAVNGPVPTVLSWTHL